MTAKTPVYEYVCPPLPLGLFDLGGVLYHANYFQLLEQARESLLAEFGCPYPELAANSQHLAIAESHQKFLKPIRYGDKVLVRLCATELRQSSVTLSYELDLGAPHASDTPAHIAITKLVFVDGSSGTLKPARLPEKLAKIFDRFLAANSPTTEV